MTGSREADVRDIYHETQAFYQARVPALGRQAYGFRILYGPPTLKSPVLFVGYQPGGDVEHLVESQHSGWPDRSDYAVATFKLARRVREIWHPSVIERSTGLNAIFFRSPTAADWRRVPLTLRRELEQFSHGQVLKLIRILAPERIVFVGMGTMARFVTEAVEVLKVDGRVLIREGTVSGAPAYGVIHLSGAHIRTAHLSAIRGFFRNQISN